MEPTEKQFAPGQPNPMLDKINSILEELGIGKKCENLPKKIPGTEILNDKTVLLVDDSDTVFEGLVSHLVVATEEKAKFIKHKGESIESIADQIIETKADVILLDNNLSDGIKGPDVVSYLRSKGFTALIIGFSSEDLSTTETAFKKAGANGAIYKGIFLKDCVKELADFLNAQSLLT